MSIKERLASVTGKILSWKSDKAAAQAASDVKSVRLARETRDVHVNPGTGAQPADESEKFAREVLVARARTAELKRGVAKRAKKYAK